MHPECTPGDAVDAYMARVPDKHVEGSCIHHGERGCTLDRDMRSETCNTYACEPLRQVENLNMNAPVPVVAAMQHHYHLDRAALLDEAGVTRIPARSRRGIDPQP